MPTDSKGRILSGPLALLVLLSAAACGGAGPAPERADLLIVTIDSLRADRPGFAGGAVKTPAMDRLAGEGAVFSSAYTTAPQGLPALASLHTGLYPASHGARLDGASRLSDGVVTLAARLKREGYLTAAFAATATLHGKFGLGAGFDAYRVPPSGGAGQGGLPTVPAPRLADHVLEWLESLQKGQRFFLWVNFFDTHYFHSPPSPFKEAYDVPYDGEVALVDRELGRILDGLGDHGRGSTTLVVLAGNHGEGLGDGGEQYHGILLRDSTLRVPLIVRPPGAAHARRVDAPVSLVDVAPTVLDLLGLEAPLAAEGRSLRAAIEGTGEVPAGREIYFETLLPQQLFGWAPLRGVRSGSLKYVEAPGTGWSELYDLDAEEGESVDLGPQRGGDLARLAAAAGRLGGRVPQGAARALEEPLASMIGSLGLATVPEEAALKLPPENVDVGNAALQAMRSLQRRMVRSSLFLLNEVLESDPQNYSGLMGAAAIAAGMNQPSVAETHLKRAQALYPADGEIYHQLGHAALGAGQGPEARSEAQRLFEAAARLSPLNEEALYDTACALSQGDPDRALDYLEQAVRNGYRNFGHMAVDPDMDPIRETARFRQITEGLAVPPSSGAPGEGEAPPGGDASPGT